jgi:hypothetical protein
VVPESYVKLYEVPLGKERLCAMIKVQLVLHSVVTGVVNIKLVWALYEAVVTENCDEPPEELGKAYVVTLPATVLVITVRPSVSVTLPLAFTVKKFPFASLTTG